MDNKSILGILKAKFVNENIEFKRGKDPAEVLKIGIWRYPNLKKFDQYAKKYGFKTVDVRGNEPGQVPFDKKYQYNINMIEVIAYEDDKNNRIDIFYEDFGDDIPEKIYLFTDSPNRGDIEARINDGLDEEWWDIMFNPLYKMTYGK